MENKEAIATSLPRRKHKAREVAARIAMGGLVLAGVGVAVKIGNEIYNNDDNGFNPLPITQGIKDNVLQKLDRNIVSQNTRNGVYEMSPVPGREPDSFPNIPTSTAISDIPHIPDEEPLITPNITLGATFIKVHETIVNSEPRIALPTVFLSGYLVAKEKQKDGSVMFAIELPRLSPPKDILRGDIEKSTGEIKEPTYNYSAAETKLIGGRIVWIRLFEGQTPAHYPFATNIVWGLREFQSLGTASDRKAGTGDKPLTEYARPGDLIRAKVDLDSGGVDLDSYMTTKDFQEGFRSFIGLSDSGETVDQAKKTFKNILASNAQNAQSLADDIAKPISLAEQIRDKPYVFTPVRVAFIPK